MAEIVQPSSDSSDPAAASRRRTVPDFCRDRRDRLHHARADHVRLGVRDVCSGNEAVEGVFVQQMVEHGKSFCSRSKTAASRCTSRRSFTGPPPPSTCARDIKKVTAFNLRLPSALYAVAGVILTMLFAYDLLGLEAAVLAGLTLAGAFQYITLGRFGRVDMTLAFYEALSLFAFFWWIGPKPTEHPSFAQETVSEAMQYVLAIALGLAVLAKGPVGALPPARAMGFSFSSRDACAKLFVGFRCLR